MDPWSQFSQQFGDFFSVIAAFFVDFFRQILAAFLF